jgi:PAS domain S-box-containing protein
MIIASADRRLLQWNAAFTKLTGYNNKELGDTIISTGLTAPEWHENETKAVEKLQRTGKSQTFQKEYIRKDGLRVPVEVLVYQLTDDEGKVRRYYVGLITDITERKQSEEALKESEERYRSLVQLSPDAIIVASEGMHVFVNNSGMKLFGASSPDQIIGKPVLDFIHPDYREFAAERMRKVIETGIMVPIIEEKFIRIDGTEIDVEVGAAPLVYQGKPAIQAVIRDITQHKQAEEALRQSEEKYRSILEDIKEGYWEVDLAGNFTSFNDAICRIVGYDKTEMTGMNYRAYTNAENVGKVYKAFNQVHRTGQPIRNIHYEIVKKDGSKRFAETSVFQRQNDKKETIGFRGVSHDITERKNMEEALIHSEERYRTILDEMQDGYFEVDLAGNYTFTNEANCRNLGYPREELIGVNYRATTAAEDIDKVYQAFNQVYRTGQSSKAITFKIVQKDGSTGQAEILASPLRNKKGEIIGFRGIGRDITERMKMEESLRRSEEKYRSILETIEESYYEVDLAGSFTFVNDTLCRQFGYSREELMGMNYKVYTPAEVSKKVFGAYNQVYRTGEPLKWFPMEQIRKDGTRLVLENSVSPIRNEKGEIIGFRGVGRDVTERLRMEEVLRRSEEKYRTIMDEMQDSYFELDLAGNCTFANEADCRNLGYHMEELIGMNYRAYTAAEDADKVYQTFNQAYLTGQPSRAISFKIIQKDGSTRQAELSAFPLQNEKGEIIGFRGVGRDVTERLRMEEALGQSEKRYRTVMDDMEEAYFEEDLAGNFTFFNDETCRQLGYSREELMGMNYRSYVSPERVKEAFEIFNRIYRTGETMKMFDVQEIRKDGTSIFVESSASPLRNEKGEIIGFRGVARDNTERVQMKEALRRSEEKYRTILQDMKEAYYEMDLTGNYTFFNDALCRQLGYSREELMGMSYKVYVPPEKSKEASEIYNRIYRTGEPAEMLDVVQIRKDGKRIFAESSAAPIRNEKDEIIGFRGVIRDVSERKRAEEERKQMEQRAQFASRLASVGELASGVAHEINNPLTGVIGYAHLLLARKDLSRDVRRDLEIINEGAQRVAGIVKKLLVFARQTKPEQRYVNINELIRITLDLRTYELAASNIKVSLQFTRDMPMTIADPGQLQQVFLNLIINAETEMKLTHDKGKLSIKTEKINNILRITFKDTGPGIAKENLETIFDPFFTTREVGQGTGLGLSVCHGIVTEHNGKIWAESELGKGATFIIELPLTTEEKQLEPTEPIMEEPKKITKAKILVVDDEPVIRQFVSQVLGEQGHTVETADNATDALKMVKSKRYRLILLDIKMPGMSGLELYKQFQKIAPSLTKRVVFITGDVMGKRTLAFLDKTKTPYMMKPFDAKQLKAEINRILARK